MFAGFSRPVLAEGRGECRKAARCRACVGWFCRFCLLFCFVFVAVFFRCILFWFGFLVCLFCF